MATSPDVIDNPALESALAKSGAGLPKKQAVDEPLYKVVGDSKVPVAKHTGSLWQSRRDQGLGARKSVEQAWDEAIRYYENDQMAHRDGSENRSGNQVYGRRLNKQWTETENVVFANCSIMVPMLYAKNPTISVSTEIEAYTALADAISRLGNKLIDMKRTPGLNVKPKMRRAILSTLLTNSAIAKIGWVRKEDSSEQAIQQLQELSQQLEQAKNRKEIMEVEGKIMALEEKIALLSPSGPTLKMLSAHQIVRDPTAQSPELGDDDNWIMEWDFLPTDYLNAVYGQKHGEETRSIYQPTHVLEGKSGVEAVEQQVNSFRLIQNEGEIKAAAYGYGNEKAFKTACHTKVWYVWDRVTRRVLMFADNNWTWPIWVWDDPLKLPRFFPYYGLHFHESVVNNTAKGEVTYYLDQQDAINDINDEVARSRRWARRNVFYNKNTISQQDVESVLKGDDGTARGIDVPEGMKMDDVIFTLTPPALRIPELFSPDSKFAAINRITGINDAMRGAQFKTNTTNKAVETYNQNTDIRVDERVDLIEEFFADIMWGILQLCLMNWDAEDVINLIGQQAATSWQRVTDPRMFDTQISCRVEGGSTQKPNSTGKKKEAAEIGQVLGQFASGAPAIAVPMLKMFERAFEGTVIVTDEDWAMIMQSIAAQMQPKGGAPTDPNAEQGGQPAQNDEQLKAQLQQKIQNLPPAAQKELEKLVQQGVPPSEALQQIEGQLQTAAKQ